MNAKHLLIDIPRQDVSNGRWHSMWFLMIENLFPLKDEAPKYGQEALVLRSRSHKLALNSSKGEKVVANKNLQVASRSSKGGTWKSIVGA
jgi:hypothetical protein